MIPNWMSGWRRAALFAFVLTVISGALSPARAGVIALSDCVPPLDPHNAYLGQYHRWAIDSGSVVLLTSPSHNHFTNCTPPPASGTTTDSFDSTVEGDLSVDGVPFGHFVGAALSSVNVTFDHASGATRFYNTEIVQLDIAAGGILIRESPTKQSTGQTTITDLGSGRFLIDSFFDVFTELSVDGGATWTPSSGPDRDGSTRMTLTTVPEPASLLLVGTGLAIARRRFRARTSAD